MKILICSISTALGGMERRIEAETKLLTRLGHTVFVATPHFSKLSQWQRDIKAAGGKYIYWRPYKFIERQHLAAPFRWLARLSIPMLRYYKIDLAHIALPWNFVGISLAYVLSAARIPFVMGVHCKFDSKNLPKKSLPFAKQALRSLKGVYAVSAPVKDSFVRLYQDLIPAATPIEVIHNGIDTERYQPADATARRALRERLGFAETDFVVMFCGRLDAFKRPVFALQVFADFVKNHPQGRLLIVGDGSELSALKTEINALQLQDKVILAGQAANTTPYYQASDGYISTSVAEGFSLTTAEALACGLPAVVPNDDVFALVYGMASAVQRCDAVNPAEWRQALLSVAALDPAARQALSQAARAFAKEHLATEVMNQKLTLFYANITSTLSNKHSLIHR